MSRGAWTPRVAKAVVAAVLVAATGLALLSFVLHRAGADGAAAALLDDLYGAAFLCLTVLLSAVFARTFDR